MSEAEKISALVDVARDMLAKYGQRYGEHDFVELAFSWAFSGEEPRPAMVRTLGEARALGALAYAQWRAT